jgi:MFS transporter, OPA family, glycerol-3-phosphate transporter
MDQTSTFSDTSQLEYPKGFRARRGLNWGFLGLLYTSYYLCRYNFSIANPYISAQYGFNETQMGWIITANLLAYAFGQIINGLLTDRLGGRKAMMIGALGTVTMNLAFGASSFFGMLGLFVAIWGVNGYIQSFGAPGMIKINTAWFAHRERGRFAGIFGFMINLGRFGIFKLGTGLLAGSLCFGLVHFAPLHWRWLFWAPSIICLIVAIGMWLTVKETPEEAGFTTPGEKAVIPGASDVHASIKTVVKAIFSNPTVWVVALAYACTGAVRQGIDQWFPKYMTKVYGLDIRHSSQFDWMAFWIPFVASVGSWASGYVSDTVFKGRRAPVAAVLYFVESLIIVLAAQFHTTNATIVFFVLISLTANSTHSILGTAAAMDIGGRKMAGFVSGVIDSFQYFGGSLAGLLLGWLIDHHGWGVYFYFMVPFGVIGGLLMVSILGKVTKPTH